MTIEAGYYWICAPAGRYAPARWTVAKFDGNDELGWTFVGSLHLVDTVELFGSGDDQMGYVLGPRIKAPPL